jgi:dipeptidyl aminopeptidase/acylaminoacyl peptidase
MARHLKSIVSPMLGTLVICIALAAMDPSERSVGRPRPIGMRPDGAREATVADVIRLTDFVNPDPSKPYKRSAALFSPDAKHFIVILKHGNIERNTNDYTLLVYETATAFGSPTPVILASLSSPSNAPGISEPTWIGNDAVAFLGQSTAGTSQLYLARRNARQVAQLTHHSTDVTAYVIDRVGRRYFFTATKSPEPLIGEDAKRHGVVVSTQPLLDLLTLKLDDDSLREELFLQTEGSGQERLLKTRGWLEPTHLWLSPDGRRLLLETFRTEAPPGTWRQYDDQYLRQQVASARNGVGGEFFLIQQLELIDTQSDIVQVLVNAPIASLHSPSAVWSPDSQSVVVAGTYLPLDVRDPAERETRRKEVFAAEIEIPTLKITPIVAGKLEVKGWDSSTGKVQFETTDQNKAYVLERKGTIIAYEKNDGRWRKVEISPSEVAGGRVDAEIVEDMNSAPKMYAMNLETGRRALLLDPNPQFRQLTLAHVEDISFKATDGHSVNAGLYLPPHYVAGRKYPVVIQTHGWNPERFWADGPYSTAFAAQPLVGRGMVVVQLAEDLKYLGTPAELKEESAAYEGVIDYLVGRNLVDSNRVGIIAFSRTCMSLRYFLTHSRHHLAAVTIADGWDDGYFRYVAELNSTPFATVEAENMNGGAPYGPGLVTWMRNDFDFSLDRVHSPLRIEAIAPRGLFFQWEWFTILSRQEKPVELIYIPDGYHVLQKPWNRIASQQGNVEWYDFWLNGHEDLDPAKGEQYRRWEKLCDMQVEQNPHQAAFCVRSKTH